MTVFNYVDASREYSTSSSSSSSAIQANDIADLISPLNDADGVLFRRRFFVLFFRRLGVLTSHVAVIPFIANRVLKAFVILRRCIGDGGDGGYDGKDTRTHAATASSSATAGATAAAAAAAAKTEWREFMRTLLLGVSLPVGVVVVFFVVVPATFGPLMTPSWIWFYLFLFFLFTFGPLVAVAIGVVILGWKYAGKRRRLRGLDQETAPMTVLNGAVCGSAPFYRGTAPMASVEDLTEDENRGLDSNLTTLTVENGINPGPQTEVHRANSNTMSSLEMVTNPFHGLSMSICNGPQDLVNDPNRLHHQTQDSGIESDHITAPSLENGAVCLNRLRESMTDGAIHSKRLKASMEDDVVGISFGVILLLCNVSWIWFLLDPRPVSWMTFSALGMINSSLNLFVCLFCCKQIATQFSLLTAEVVSRISRKWRK